LDYCHIAAAIYGASRIFPAHQYKFSLGAFEAFYYTGLFKTMPAGTAVRGLVFIYFFFEHSEQTLVCTE